MFDFDATKLMIVGVLALIVLGPNELPRVMRQLGQMLGKMRRMAGEFQGQFMDAMREAELQDLRKEVDKLNQQAKDAVNVDVGALDPAAELRKAAEGAPASPAPDAALDIAPPEPFRPLTSADLEAAFTPQPDPTLAKPAAPPAETPPVAAPAEPAPAPAPARAADAFYMRPGAKPAPTAGVELAPDEEFTFRKAPPAPGPAAASDAPRRRSARPTGA